MNIHETIIAWISGGTLIASVYHTAFYFLTKDKLLGAYCRYLWFCTGNSLVFVIFFDESINDFNSTAATLGDLFFHLIVFAYCVFLASAFGVSSKNHRRLWLLYRTSLIIFFLQGLSALYARLFMSFEGNLFFLIPAIICNAYGLFFTIYSLFYFSKLVKTRFLFLILVGAVVNSFVVIGSAVFIFLLDFIEPFFGQLFYAGGMFVDMVMFSIAMGYKFKENIDEKLLAISKASEYQLTMYKAEMQKENEIAMGKEMERKRLSQDLHDDLANSIAYIKTNIETEIVKSDDIGLQDRLQKISEHVTNAYQQVRNKSHEWYHLLSNETEAAFNKRIQTLLDEGLPDERYQKRITIDDGAMQNVLLEVKVEILFFIKEAIANVLKHAEAYKVEILIYQDIQGLILQITDDGKGFDVLKEHEGIGLKSLKNRILKLKGTVAIQSDKSGTTIQAIIPL